MDKKTLVFMQNMLTKTQYKYWYAYYVLDMSLQEIADEYGVHITTVSHVLNNARTRMFKDGRLYAANGGATNG